MMKALKYPATKRQLRLLALAGLAVVCSTSVMAQSAPGWYIGGNLGGTRADFKNDSVNRSLAGQGFTVNSTTTDNRSSGGKIFGGYQLTPNFAVEGGYFDLGRFSYGSTTTPAGTFSGNTRVNGLNLDLVGMAPLSDRFSVFGRVGAAYAQNRGSVASTGFILLNTSNVRRNDTKLKVGLGIQYAISDALAVRAELERYRISDPIRNRSNIDMASIGLVYSFGGKVQTPVAPVYVPVAAAPPPPPPAPVYVAPPPPPAPVYVAPPPPPAPVYVAPVRPAKQGRN
jgi:OOP family OmpA-OmpF porin